MIGPVPAYSCPAGATLSGSSCTAPVTQAASVSGYSCSSGTLSGSSCLSTSTAAASVSYSCAPGQALSGTSCSSSSTASTGGTPIYSCPADYTLAGTSCTQQGTATMVATASFSCASGTLSGANCLGALRRTRYEAYGNTAAGAVPTGLGFTGHVNDADTGLVYMQQRYYDPIAARFMSVDPIVTDPNTGKGFNVYEYANNNPYRYIDPDGRDAWYKEDSTQTLPTIVITGSRAPVPSVPANAPGGPVSQPTWGEVTNWITRPTPGCEANHCLTGTVPLPGMPNVTTVIGRVKDLKNLGAAERSLLDRLPNLGDPKLNWQQNAGVLRQEMGRGLPIRDASPGDGAGQFLNAERYLLKDRGWRFDAGTNYWMPPGS